MESMCPHCGWRYRWRDHETDPWGFVGLVPIHGSPLPNAEPCPGTGQAPRNPESDRRRLWKDGGEP